MLKKHVLPMACCAALLVACGNGNQTPAENTAAAPRTRAQAPADNTMRTGVVETEGGAYSFSPTSCGVHVEDGFNDIEISGPGTAPDGEPVFIEFSSTANELDIALGVNTPFASADRILRAGQHVTQTMDIQVDGRTIRVAHLVLVDSDGQRQTGSLEINCR